MSAIQSIIFDKKYFNLYESKMWLRQHNFYTNVDKKTNTLRYRQENPKHFDHFITKEIEPGIKFVIGFY